MLVLRAADPGGGDRAPGVLRGERVLLRLPGDLDGQPEHLPKLPRACAAIFAPGWSPRLCPDGGP